MLHCNSDSRKGLSGAAVASYTVAIAGHEATAPMKELEALEARKAGVNSIQEWLQNRTLTLFIHLYLYTYIYTFICLYIFICIAIDF